MELTKKNIQNLEDILENMRITEQVEVFNTACDEMNWENRVWEMDEHMINDLFHGVKPYDILNSLDKGFDTYDDYFYMDSSSGYWKSCKEREMEKELSYYWFDVADYAIRHYNDLDNKKIREFLDEE